MADRVFAMDLTPAGAPLSIDPSGTWSLRQATAVLAVINPEAERYGVRFEMVDVTTLSIPRVLLQTVCIRHNYPVAPDAVCDMCLKESR